VIAKYLSLIVVSLMCNSALALNASLGEELLQENCRGCHTPIEQGLSRISQQRKTAEGWEMTINRMRTMHGLQLRHEGMTEVEVLGALVKHLADSQGLAPSETEGVRYLLERDGNRTESFEPLIAETCGRCHSSARVALQRRTPDEWDRTVDFHLGQWPSTEYSLYGRDRPWLKIAREQAVPMLAEQYPLESSAWEAWQEADKPVPTGTWVLAGHIPGEGEFSALMTVTAEPDQPDRYRIALEGNYADGSELRGSGASIVYTGYEWRAGLSLGDLELSQAFALSADGRAISGRMYQRDQEQIGAPIVGIRSETGSRLLSVYPKSVAADQESVITLTGSGLSADNVSFDDLEVVEVLSDVPHRVQLRVRNASGKKLALQNIYVNNEQTDVNVAVYQHVDDLQIEPAYGVARIGGNGGGAPKLEAVFRARGISWGSDGVAGTEDDIDLGYIDDVTWQAVPRDETAKHDNDVAFAGDMDARTGRFVPAGAGPNPARARSTNNAGNLNVVATYQQEGRVVEGTGRLLVTVQRWVNPPLK